MKKLLAGLLAASVLLPATAFALFDCGAAGCTTAELTTVANDSSASKENRIQALQQLVAILTAQISNLIAHRSDTQTSGPSGESTLCNGGLGNLVHVETSKPSGAWTCSCPVISKGLILGMSDTEENGEIAGLQLWLRWKGFFPDAEGTGYYGEKTAAAVVKWQKAHGMDFVTTKSGVGTMTRAKIQEACTSSVVAQCPTSDSPPVISSITPSSGPIGTVAEIRGCNLSGFEGDLIANFEKDGKSWKIGDNSSVRNSSEMQVKVQEPCRLGESYFPAGDASGIPRACTYDPMTTGTYWVSTTPWGKKSNAVTFTVTTN